MMVKENGKTIFKPLRCAKCKKETFTIIVEETGRYFCSWNCYGEFHKKTAQHNTSS